MNNEVRFDVLNTGGVASNLIVKPMGTFRCEISKHVIPTNEQVTLTITAPDLSKIDGAQIQITCNDQMEKSYSLLYRYDFRNRSLIRDKDEPH